MSRENKDRSWWQRLRGESAEQAGDVVVQSVATEETAWLQTEFERGVDLHRQGKLDDAEAAYRAGKQDDMLRALYRIISTLAAFPLPPGSAEAELVGRSILQQTTLEFRRAVFLGAGSADLAVAPLVAEMLGFDPALVMPQLLLLHLRLPHTRASAAAAAAVAPSGGSAGRPNLRRRRRRRRRRRCRRHRHRRHHSRRR